MAMPVRGSPDQSTTECPACSPAEQSIASLASMGGGRNSCPCPTAPKLPVGLEGKTVDQIATPPLLRGENGGAEDPL